MKLFKLTTLIIVLYVFAPAHIQAQSVANEKPPIEITADQSLEWDRGNQVFYAKGNAVAKQGDTQIDANMLTAQYRDGAKGGTLDIWQFTADQNVTLISGDTTAYGDKAVYNLDKSIATLTGKNLRLTAPDQTITARDTFEYFMDKGQLVATGAVTIVQRATNGQTNRLTASKIIATLANTSKGRTIQKVEAFDNVVITTPSETLSGTYGIYNAGASTAEIKGNVKIKRGPNTLEGARASVDLNTNISTMYGGKTAPNNGRVRAIFYPSSQ